MIRHILCLFAEFPVFHNTETRHLFKSHDKTQYCVLPCTTEVWLDTIAVTTSEITIEILSRGYHMHELAKNRCKNAINTR